MTQIIQIDEEILAKLPKPFLGTILLEAVEDDMKEYLAKKRGLDKDSTLAKSGFEVVYAEKTTDLEAAVTGSKYKMINHNGVPICKGRIIAKADDAYGEAFERRYGKLAVIPQIGQVVYYIPGQGYKVDIDGKFLLINDEDVKAVL